MTLPSICELAQGGTAVGTGFTAPVGFAEKVAERIAAITALPFVTAPNKFEALAAHDALVFAHGALNATAASLFGRSPTTSTPGLGAQSRPLRAQPSGKRARLLDHARQGQSDAERGDDHGLHPGLRQSDDDDHRRRRSGHFELNVYNPVMAYNFLQSVKLLSDSARSFADYCVVGIEPRRDIIEASLERSLMLVTALRPKIGYDACAKIAKAAHHNNTTLREEAVGGGYVTNEEFDALMRPEKMIGPG